MTPATNVEAVPGPSGAEVAGPWLAAVPQWQVLLIDDSEPERELLRAWLEESCRFTVVGEASDGPAGVALAAELRPELVVLDLSMPGGDGIKALAKILLVSPPPAVVFFSGFLSAHLGAALLREGASACLDKNVGPVGLIEELLRVVGDLEVRKT
jgi:DNA-binding NarL/FixJ family response regulator